MTREYILGHGIDDSDDGLFCIVYVILESGLKRQVFVCQTYKEARSRTKELFDKYTFVIPVQTSAQAD